MSILHRKNSLFYRTQRGAEVGDLFMSLVRQSAAGRNVSLGLILLFCCGLRRTELLRLTLDHIDLEQSLIRIENTKFHKSRLVPLSPTVANEVAMYFRQRQQMKVAMHPKAFLLANGIQGDKAYADHTLLTVWHRLCLSIHLVDSHGRPLAFMICGTVLR